MKFLIVDDQQDFRILLRGLLSQYGKSDLAATGEAALELFQQALDDGQPYDAVFLDVVMPFLDGHETLKAMRILAKNHERLKGRPIRFIMASLLDDEYTILRAEIVSGADAYLTKPLDAAHLSRTLEDLRLI